MVRNHHARYFLKLAERAEPELLSHDSTHWLTRATQGHFAFAVRLLGVADALCERVGSRWPAYQQERIAHALADLRQRLSEGAYLDAWAGGRAVADGDVLTLACQTHEAAEALSTPSLLTRREREVATLIARGLTDRAIGQTLVITERTASAHVENILRKLGMTARAQIAAWAVGSGLAAAP